MLVRPDGMVAARRHTHPEDPAAWLDGALSVALGTCSAQAALAQRGTSGRLFGTNSLT